MEQESGLTTQAEPSLRDMLAENLAAVEVEQPEVTTEETAEQKAERLRDERGRFAAAPQDTAAQGKPATPTDTAAPTATPAAAEPKHQRPSSWKKEMWGHWETLNPELQQYITQREGEYAKGVSTYKQEYDRLKSYEEAISPILPVLEQNGRDFGEWVNTMGRVHQTFAFGSPQQKIQATLQLLQDYNVPLLDYLQQGGQLPQFNPQQTQQQPQAAQQADPRKVFEQMWTEREMQQEIKQFRSARDDKGNPKYPHFETVKQSMVGLLQAGLADDLDGAYHKAIRMNDDLWQAEQQRKADAEKAEAEAKAQQELEAKRQKVSRARANAVSTPSATPTGTMTSGGDKGLRDTIAENLRAVAGGRV
jgi:hypothetical protein